MSQPKRAGKIRNKLLIKDDRYWLVEQATTFTEARNAITQAQVTGSIGATLATVTPEGKTLEYAKVSELVKRRTSI